MTNKGNNVIGQTFTTEDETYTFVKGVSINRPNADIYLCQDLEGNLRIGKLYVNRVPRSVVGYSIYNHYGRGRDGSNLVFQQVKAKSEVHGFLARYYHRVRFQGSWLILMEYIEGPTLRSFIRNTYQLNLKAVKDGVKSLAESLAEWHNNGFAHGDPHLENSIYSADQVVKLIDYGQIHHMDFKHCLKYHCIKDNKLVRIYEDFENSSNKLGNGFRNDLHWLQQELGLGKCLTRVFNSTYKSKTTLDIFPTGFFY